MALKPKEVFEAESKGLTVERQGEWFFIPINNADEMLSQLSSREVFMGELDKDGEIDAYGSRTYVLRAGQNRPNYAQNGFTFDGKAYVSGLIEHSGREHRTVNLKQWCYAIPNTATESFTITGDID